MDGDRINVVGTLVTDEDLANLTNDDIERIFYGGIDTGNSRRGEEAESEEEEEEDMEDLETEETNESFRVVNFESFKSGRLYESGEEDDTSDVLEAFQGPAFIAIYVCDEPNSKAYASREIGRKKRLPRLKDLLARPPFLARVMAWAVRSSKRNSRLSACRSAQRSLHGLSLPTVEPILVSPPYGSPVPRRLTL